MAMTERIAPKLNSGVNGRNLGSAKKPLLVMPEKSTMPMQSARM